MPIDYSQSKVISIGIKGHSVGDSNSFLLPTTSNKNIAIADIRRKYKEFKSSPPKGSDQPYYTIIDQIGSSLLSCFVVDEFPFCKNKNELNELFQIIHDQIHKSIYEIIQQHKPELKPISIQTYTTRIQYLKMKLNTIHPMFYKETEKVILTISTDEIPFETQKNYYKALIAYVPYYCPTKTIYKSQLMESGKNAQDIVDKNELLPRYLEKWTDYKTLVERYKIVEEQGITKEFIVASFYCGVLFAPWRNLELIHLKFRNPNIEMDNYIDFENHEFVLNQYKTIKDYGRIRQPIPDSFFKAIEIFIDSLKENGGDCDYLIQHKKGGQANHYVIRDILISTLGCGCNLLRQIYATHMSESGQMNTNEQIKKVAKEMRNSFEVCLAYRKFA